MVGASTTLTSSATSGIPSDVHKRILEASDNIKAAIHKHFASAAVREQEMASKVDVIRSNPAIGRKLIDSELSADDFVQGLTSHGLDSGAQNVGITQHFSPSQTNPPQHQVHGIEPSQSTLKTSISEPRLNAQVSTQEDNFDAGSRSDLERYLRNNDSGIIGGRQELIDRCKDRDQDLILAKVVKNDEDMMRDVAADSESAIAPISHYVPNEKGSNFKRFLWRFLGSQR